MGRRKKAGSPPPISLKDRKPFVVAKEPVEVQPTIGPPYAARQEARLALHTLLRAVTAAEEAGDDPWQFAVEADMLLKIGISATSLRVLVRDGLAEMRVEHTRNSARARSFSPVASLALLPGACLVLTPEGRASLKSRSSRKSRAARPRWDGISRILYVDQLVVKQFKVPARMQEIVLATFEEAGRPESIDDPLPRQQAASGTRRLHNTICALNRGHQHCVLRFVSNGTAEGIRWEWLRVDRKHITKR